MPLQIERNRGPDFSAHGIKWSRNFTVTWDIFMEEVENVICWRMLSKHLLEIPKPGLASTCLKFRNQVRYINVLLKYGYI